MTENYFSKFPQIIYNNKITRNISERVTLPVETRALSQAFYPFELGNGLRSDSVAANYYSDPTIDWLIWLTNGMTDVDYDWYLYPDEFNNMLQTKYGNPGETQAAAIANAQRKIAYFQTNWADDQIQQSVAGFEALPAAQQKYYVPVFGAGRNILSYQRRQEDWVASTNLFNTLQVVNTSGFSIGDICSISLLDDTRGEIEYVGNNTIILKHITATDTLDWASHTITNDAGASTSISSATQQFTIPLSELVYWNSVSFYDYENNLNESKRHVYLLDKNYAQQTAENIRKKLQNV